MIIGTKMNRTLYGGIHSMFGVGCSMFDVPELISLQLAHHLLQPVMRHIQSLRERQLQQLIPLRG